MKAVSNGKWGSNCLLTENADKTVCLICNRNTSIMTEYIRHLYQSRKNKGNETSQVKASLIIQQNIFKQPSNHNALIVYVSYVMWYVLCLVTRFFKDNVDR